MAGPVDGTSYSVGTVVSGYTIKAISETGGAELSGLTAGKLYQVICWPFKGSGGSENYKTDGTPKTANFNTLFTEPSNHPSGLTGNWNAGPPYTHIAVSWSAPGGGASGYILVRKAFGQVDWTPTDGTTYTEGQNYGGNIIVAVQAGTSKNDTGAFVAVDNYYAVFAYNGSGSGINYKQTPASGIQIIKVDAIG